MQADRIRYNPAHDYYDVLGVSPGATPAETLHAYRVAVKRYHPDAGGDPSGEKIRLITEAYAVIRDPVQRHYYDRARSRHGVPGAWAAPEQPPSYTFRRRYRWPRLRRFFRAAVVTASVITVVLLLVVLAVSMKASRMTGPSPTARRWRGEGNGSEVPSPERGTKTPYDFATPFDVNDPTPPDDS